MPEKCYFCGKDAIKFHEHYYFCPECSAIYTYLIVWKSNCKHIKDRIPTATRPPWYKDVRESKAYIEEVGENHRCSICKKPCSVDGW